MMEGARMKATPLLAAVARFLVQRDGASGGFLASLPGCSRSRGQRSGGRWGRENDHRPPSSTLRVEGHGALRVESYGSLHAGQDTFGEDQGVRAGAGGDDEHVGGD